MNGIVFALAVLAVPAGLAAPPPEPVAPRYYRFPPGVTNRLPMTPLGRTNLLQLHALTNGTVRIYTNLPPGLAARSGSPGMPGPGVYETAPFTCIVVVPGTHPDDKMVKPTAPGIEMPTVKPDLQFIPRKNKGK